MRRATLLAVAVVAVLVALPVAGAAAAGGGPVAQTDNATNATNATSPGERLSGVVGVQGAELEGEVETRRFGLQVARAASEDARAAVVREQLGEVREGVETVRQRKAALDEARANGSMSEGEYRVRVSELAVRGGTVAELANRTSETAGGLPAAVLEANGVNVTAIQRLQQEAGNLTGPEVAAIARSIAGPGVGRPVGVPRGPPGSPGVPGDATGTPDGADRNVTETPDGNVTGGTDGNTSDTADGDTGGTPDGQRDGGSGSSGGQETDTRSGERSGA
jgi:hypothetical protein